MVLAVVVQYVAPNQVQAAEASLLITGLQTAGVNNSGQEQISIANVSSGSIDLMGTSLGYFSADPASFVRPARTISLSGSIAAGHVFTLATSAGTTVDQVFSATMAQAGGHLKLLHGTEQLDLLGWGTARYPLGAAAPAPQPGRKLFRRTLANGMYQQTENNAHDFMVDEIESPQLLVDHAADTFLVLSEMLPNPKSPTLDNEGEYVEVWNSGPLPMNIRGYTLLVGPTLGKKYVFQDEVLGANTYKAFYSAQTKLALSNEGSRVQLQAPDGSVLSDVTYETAREGMAWAWSGSEWQWTLEPTPDGPNKFHVEQGTTATPKTSSSRAATAKKAAKKLPSKAASGRVKAVKTTQPVSIRQQQSAPVHNAVVAGVGGLAVLYGLYEYRNDAANLYHKLRRNRKTG